MRLLIVTVRIALRALRRNTLRSLLTILGIIIGVAAVIAMVSIGQGASVAVQEQIARMGNNMLVILSGSVTQGGVRTGAGRRSTLRVSDARAMQRECPAVSAVTYLRRQVQQVVRLHGGRIRLRSRADEGTQVTLELPLQVAKPVAVS